MTITIEIPMPPARELFPNAEAKRRHWGVRAEMRAECREMAKYAAMETAQRCGPIAGPVTLTIHAAYGYKRTLPDLEATIAACKPYVDGIVDAGVLYDDDQVKKITATHEKLTARRKEKPIGFTRFVITEMSE